jgi:hypothetical protein
MFAGKWRTLFAKNALWDALCLSNVVREMRPIPLVRDSSRELGKGYRDEHYASDDCCKRLEHGHHSV